MNKNIVNIFIIVSLVFLLIGCSNLQEQTKENNKDEIVVITDVEKAKKKAQNFKIEQINPFREEEKIVLDEFEVKGIISNVWATYTEPSVKELPNLGEIYTKYNDDIEIIAISVDPNEKDIQNFISKKNIKFLVAHDKAGQFMDLYKLGALIQHC